MMQHVCVRCQSLQVAPHAQSTDQPEGAEVVTLVSDPGDQQISTTCSRRLRDPKEFLDAVVYMKRHHSKANDTTVLVAQDIARRMPNSKDGHIAYAVTAMQ